MILLLLFIQRLRGPSVHSRDPRTDEELYRRYADGDERAFRVLLDRHGGEVLGYLARFFGDREMATDLTQDVFLKVIAAAADFRGDSSFRTFLFRIVRNLCIDVMRSRSSRPDARARSLDAPAHGDDDARPLSDSLAGPAPEADLRTLSGELSGALEVALARLPVEQREVFLMREVDGLRFPEIATILGVNENTVRGRMHTAVTRLRQDLSGFRERT
jgi:RNA polymerase sigma-70 factor, ECF subfamily